MPNHLFLTVKKILFSGSKALHTHFFGRLGIDIYTFSVSYLIVEYMEKQQVSCRFQAPMASNDGNSLRVFMWFIPRTVSVAFTKCLSAIEGMEVWFEAFSYCGMTRKQYRDTYGKDIPMEYEGNEEEAQKGAKLFERLVRTKIEPDRIVYGNLKQRFEASRSKYLVTKEMFIAFPDEKTRKYLPSGCKHVFLIRDPYRVFKSYRDAIYGQLQSVGLRSGDPQDKEAFDLRKDDPSVDPNEMYTGMYEVWKYIRENVDPDAVIVNTDDLLTNPAEVLPKFCHLTGLPYSESLLRWDASPDVTKTWKAAGDDVILKTEAFYKTAIYSSRFLPPRPAIPRDKLTPDVLQLADEAMPYYQEMNCFKI